MAAFLAGDPDDARLAADRTARLGDSHLAAEARAYASWATGDTNAAHEALVQARDRDPTCCCARLGTALTTRAGEPVPDPATLITSPSEEVDEDDPRCNDASCWLRARLTVARVAAAHNQPAPKPWSRR